jgi:hypothetical protein
MKLSLPLTYKNIQLKLLRPQKPPTLLDSWQIHIFCKGVANNINKQLLLATQIK